MNLTMNKKKINMYALAVLLLLVIGSGPGCSQHVAATPDELLSLGEKYLAELKYEETLVQFQELIEIDPMNPRGYTGEAEAYVGLGNTDRAITVLRQGLEQLPDNADIGALLEMLTKLSSTPDTNLANTMTESEYQNLNKFFDPFCTFTRLQDITNDKQVVEFGVWQYQDGMGEFSIPKAQVEEVLKRYFGVEKINHEALTGNSSWEIPTYNNGYYGSGGGVGWNMWNWCNVSEMFDNGDGTFRTTVSLYEYSGEYVDDSGYSWDIEVPENIYDRLSTWKLHSGQTIVDGGEAWNDTNIHCIATDTVTLRQYGDSWQIVSINGWKIPKTLFADYVVQKQEMYSINTN